MALTPFHASISFTGMGSVNVYDTPVRDILLAGGMPVNMGPSALSFFTIFMDNWCMNLLFFVSGIGAVFSLRKRSGGQQTPPELKLRATQRKPRKTGLEER